MFEKVYQIKSVAFFESWNDGLKITREKSRTCFAIIHVFPINAKRRQIEAEARDAQCRFYQQGGDSHDKQLD